MPEVLQNSGACEIWNSLIRVQDFINRHLDIAVRNPSSERVLISIKSGKSLVLESLDDEFEIENDDGKYNYKIVIVRTPPGFADAEIYGIEVIWSCNGLICLYLHFG